MHKLPCAQSTLTHRQTRQPQTATSRRVGTASARAQSRRRRLQRGCRTPSCRAEQSARSCGGQDAAQTTTALRRGHVRRKVFMDGSSRRNVPCRQHARISMVNLAAVMSAVTCASVGAERIVGIDDSDGVPAILHAWLHGPHMPPTCHPCGCPCGSPVTQPSNPRVSTHSKLDCLTLQPAPAPQPRQPLRRPAPATAPPPLPPPRSWTRGRATRPTAASRRRREHTPPGKGSHQRRGRRAEAAGCRKRVKRPRRARPTRRRARGVARRNSRTLVSRCS
eukprot:55149-Chlamydomonas_euryale.AAC.8